MTDPIRSILAGDVGGTKILLLRRSWRANGSVEETRHSYRSAEQDDLDPVLRSFFMRSPGKVDCAVLAVAGPVHGDRARLTNLPWAIDKATLARQPNLGEVLLMNDVEALAVAVPMLSCHETHTLSPGIRDEQGSLAVAALGTGLGQAYLTPRGGRYDAHPSEGGHCDFAPTDQEQLSLLEFLLGEQEHVSVESVCSGLGIQNVYRFVCARSTRQEEREIRRGVAALADPTPTIIEHALLGTSRLCVRTLEIVVDILGAELGNLTLKVMATGGAYLGGGIAPRILPLLKKGRLLGTFRRKGRFGRMLAQTPVHIILADDGVVRGAAQTAASWCFGSDTDTDENGRDAPAVPRRRREGDG